MIPRTQALLLSVTALIAGIVMFTMNDVGSGFPISDGGSHYVTGLLAFDWVRTGASSNPMHFGTEYFKHLPYIGILLWPPLFYGLEMLAFSIFGPTVNVALILCTAIFVVGAALLGRAALKSGKHILVAHCIIVAVLTSALVQEVQRNVLIDGLVSVLSLAAIFQFSYYLVSPSWRGALIAGLLAVLAFYAKGNGMQLGIAFPVVALLLRRTNMLFDRRTLAMATACVLITGPWLYLTAGLSAQGFLYSLTLGAALELIGEHLRNIFLAIPVLTPFALIGAVITVRNSIARQVSEPAAVFNTACFSIIVACILFHTVIPAAADPRYMLGAIFGAVGLAASGLEAVLAWVRTRSSGKSRALQNASVIVACVFVLQVVFGVASPLPAVPTGVVTVAAEVMKSLPKSNRSVLIAADFNVETSLGPVLAELDGSRRASKDGIVVVRGSRAFAGGAYRNRDYIEKFKSDAAYFEELNRLAMPVIVTVSPKPTEQWAHIEAIERVLAASRSQYVRTSVVPFTPTQRMSVWRRKDELIRPVNFDLVSESNTFRQRVNSVVR